MKYGVFIGKDIEVVITDLYMIVYWRNISENFLESRLYIMQNSIWRCIGVCRTSPVCSIQRRPPEIWQHAFVYNEKMQSTDDAMRDIIGTAPKYFNQSEGSLQIKLEDLIQYTAVCDEDFSMEELLPVLPEISDNNIGECLKKWNMGLKEEIYDINGAQTFIGITVNTEKHMYIFEMTPNSIYCRAARYVTTNNGIVFNQNFRQGDEAYMIEDNNDASLPLQIDESLFLNNSCIWNDKSVYWSVRSCDSNCIILNGCQGDTYQWHKPCR